MCACVCVRACLFVLNPFKIALKKHLSAIFEQYGEILEIVAHGNIRMRGQAFVVFKEQESAANAIKAVQGFALHGKPMVYKFVLYYSCKLF